MANITLTQLTENNNVTGSLTGTEPFETVFSSASGGITFNNLSQTIPSPVTGTARTLAPLDQGKMINMTNSAASVLTVPSDANAAIPVNASFLVRQGGAGQVSFSPQTGVIIEKRASLSFNIVERFGIVVLHKIAANRWQLTGELEAL